MPSGFASSSFSQRQAPPHKIYNEILPATNITLNDLVNASDRNVDRGTIKKYNRQTGQYIVQLNEDDDEYSEPKTIPIEASNLQQHVTVSLSNIQSNPEFNNRKVTILSSIESKARYNINVCFLLWSECHHPPFSISNTSLRLLHLCFRSRKCLYFHYCFGY